MTERQRKRANLIRVLIEEGWNPPPPNDRATDRLLDSIENVQPNAKLELSPRELDVVRAAADGLTIPETAERLGITHWQAQDYFVRARRRLGARTQAQAVAMVARAGVL